MTSAEKRQPPEEPVDSEDGHGEHPTEPAEGAPAPGEDADAPRGQHPDDPAEG